MRARSDRCDGWRYAHHVRRVWLSVISVSLGLAACGDVEDAQVWGSAAVVYLAPDGETRQVWVMDADGSEPRVLTSGYSCWAPKWSPEGQRIAYVQLDAEPSWPDVENIMLMGPDGQPSLLAQVEDPDGLYWSADGRWIYVTYNEYQSNGYYSHINRMVAIDVETGETHRMGIVDQVSVITVDPHSGRIAIAGVARLAGPEPETWSSSFISIREPGSTASMTNELYGGDDYAAFEPHYNPVSGDLYFLHEQDAHEQLMVVAAGTQMPAPWQDAPDGAIAGRWSSDGASYYYRTASASFVRDGLDAPRQLSATGVSVMGWTPDGDWLWGTRIASEEIWRVDTRDGTAEFLAEGGSPDWRPVAGD